MTHPRKTIRDMIVSLLQAGPVTGVSSTQVFSNRSLPIEDSLLPWINVKTLPEESVDSEFCAGKLLRTLAVTLEVAAKQVNNATIDDTIDQLCEDIENIFRLNNTLSETAISSMLTSTSNPVLSIDGDYTVAKLELVYSVTYLY